MTEDKEGGSSHLTGKELFEAYNKDVYRMCLHMLRNASDAEDLCQEVFIAAMRKEWNNIEHRKAWLLKIAVNRCLNHLRKTRLVRTKEKVFEWLFTETAVKTVDYMVEEREAALEYSLLLQNLPLKIRAVVTLRYVQELTHVEIADVLNIPIGTVKSRLHKGMKLLKVMIEYNNNSDARGGSAHENVRERSDSSFERG
ncbi:RNA polymerase sigma factor [Paenibacillus prosopidis]|uniref:RNA polymerase sigma-70 factor (ECF subfamily) n=1 Tax=Paenibacillus prosopidis TaxID=630520 RepID=A0A368W2H1_9BACL|nr:RNA polymerase sigma factor [Paenibacillus prosopidis]RCW49348.1 RNA polymerase sigma-70 factor (ECF subfamily) [Paenibacillus prosopidis]